jgi:hypothetical protein
VSWLRFCARVGPSNGKQASTARFPGKAGPILYSPFTTMMNSVPECLPESQSEQGSSRKISKKYVAPVTE